MRETLGPAIQIQEREAPITSQQTTRISRPGVPAQDSTTKHDRLSEEILTPKQLMTAVQDERVQAIVSLALARESGLLGTQEFEDLKSRLREIGIPPNSIGWAVYTVAEDIKLQKGLPSRAID